MANYHTAPDCGCSQNRPRQPVPEKPCPADMSGRQMMHRPCPADMPGRPMMPKPCPADVPACPNTDCPPMTGICPHKADPLAGMPVAMAYVPWQFFHETFEPDKALQCGTIFPELSKPFCGKGGCPK